MPDCWNLAQLQTTLRTRELAATLDIGCPQRGLCDLRVRDTSLADWEILGLRIPEYACGNHEAVVDCYVRGADLVATYRESPVWPVRADARWHAAVLNSGDRNLAAVELVVSVHTEVLDSHPELSACSRLHADEVRQLSDPATAAWRELPTEPDVVVTPDATAPRCWLFRVSPTLTYVQMTDPSDIVGTAVVRSRQAEGRLVVSHRLFPMTLEKGVILRGRVRGAFLPREDDLRAGAELYQEFIAADVPLGT